MPFAFSEQELKLLSTAENFEKNIRRVLSFLMDVLFAKLAFKFFYFSDDEVD